MYSICAEAHYSIGNVAETQKYCDEVLDQDKIPILDKMRVYHCMLMTMGNSGRAPEALKLSLDILSQLKCKLPRKRASQMAKALYWLSKTKLPSKDEIAELPLMTDPTHKACMQRMYVWRIYMYIYDGLECPFCSNILHLACWLFFSFIISLSYCYIGSMPQHMPIIVAMFLP